MKYITITPPQHRGKYYVARSGIGESYYIIATCPTLDYAKLIAEALNDQVSPATVTIVEKKKAR